jgi:hypothetical protein
LATIREFKRMPRTKKVTVTPKSVTTKKTKTTKVKKTAIDKINATVAKWDAGGCPDHVKLATPDYLSLLATTLERGEGTHLSYRSPNGTVAVLPRKPKELLAAVKYLRRQSVLGLKKED